MPEHHIEWTEEERALLEQVRKKMELTTIGDAAEWLVKTRIRRVMRQTNGRGRALHVVGKDKTE